LGNDADAVNVRPWPIEIPNCFCAVTEFASVMVTVNVKLPVAVGVPAIAPVGASRVSPGGKEPALMDHVYGAVPPAALIVCE
jgi:hypothetical protein